MMVIIFNEKLKELCVLITKIIATDYKSNTTWAEVVTSKAGTLNFSDVRNERIHQQ